MFDGGVLLRIPSANRQPLPLITQFFELLGQSDYITGREEKPCLTITNRLEKPTGCGPKNWLPVGKGLHEDSALRDFAVGQDDAIGRRE